MIWPFLATLAAYLIGSLSFAVIVSRAMGLADPRRYGIDLVMPIFFAAMIVPLWRGSRGLVPWVVAGCVALLTAKLVDGYAFIITGSLAGAVTGAFRDDAA